MMLLAELCLAIYCGCFVFLLLHAFRRSVGTGFMVLCIPCYNFFYGFSQFEHRRKGLILAGLLAGFVLGIVFRGVQVMQSAAALGA